MKNKVIWTMALSILVLAVFFGMMCRRQDQGTFYLRDIEGQREYLNIFPIEGIAGDGTQGVSFRLENGEVSADFYPFGTEEIRSIFYARREGLTGIKKYGYDYYSIGLQQEMSAFTSSTPSRDATVRREEGLHPDAIENGFFNNVDIVGGETVFADSIDIYMNVWENNGNREARVATGMHTQGKEVYYTRGKTHDKESTYSYSSFNDIEMQSYLVPVGDVYYGLIAPTRECRGETGLFRFRLEGLVMPPAPETEREPYQTGEYGEAEKICSFPVDDRNHVLGVYGLGDEAFGIFRIQNGTLLFEVYDADGNLTNQDVVNTNQSDKIDYTDAEILVWDNGDISVYYRMYEVVEQDKNSQVWNTVEDGLYQINEEGLKRMECYDKSSGMFMTACRNNLIFDVSMDLGEERETPYYSGSQIYLSVINGDTGKLLYQGKMETDFYEDHSKIYSKYNIAKNAPYLDEAMRTQYMDGMIELRQRRFVDIVPINGKVGNIWWR